MSLSLRLALHTTGKMHNEREGMSVFHWLSCPQAARQQCQGHRPYPWFLYHISVCPCAAWLMRDLTLSPLCPISVHMKHFSLLFSLVSYEYLLLPPRSVLETASPKVTSKAASLEFISGMGILKSAPETNELKHLPVKSIYADCFHFLFCISPHFRSLTLQLQVQSALPLHAATAAVAWQHHQLGNPAFLFENSNEKTWSGLQQDQPNQQNGAFAPLHQGR